jgi:hypothetical protein
MAVRLGLRTGGGRSIERETTNTADDDYGDMADETPEPVAEFIDAAEQIYYEYNEGYLDPDAALSRLGDHVAELRDTYEDEA